ncbi:hypothetical protein [Aurantimicrobium photophilum]|uniref:Uncharacterized protein n=1 Tax=Aurantimicrobium photophilum TaxID=1987356 RepID=A0A2Z3RXL1_9MICO|nr:hypothetical protein [Aurantimicrobium photophilum]AWR20696.1 hypothetical protein AURMO_00071 [Aurantimicrobium photophilum]
MESVSPEPQEPTTSEIELDDDALELAAGGSSGSGMMNSTEIVYASTFIPFDSSF